MFVRTNPFQYKKFPRTNRCGILASCFFHCRDMEYHTEYCALTTRSFPRGSFLMFPSLKRRHRFDIRLE